MLKVKEATEKTNIKIILVGDQPQSGCVLFDQLSKDQGDLINR